MSINWVMLHPTQAFVRLPGEKPIYKSSPRTSLSITTPRAYPGNEPISIQSSSGTVYLTNQRVVYLPEKSTPDLQSFSAPLLNLHDSHVTVPWFGPNAWSAILQPVPGGNIPSNHAAIEVKFTFKEGGAPDFHLNFEQIKERFAQVVEAARANSLLSGGAAVPLHGVNMDSVHLDQLPSYEASGRDRVASEPPQNDEGRHVLQVETTETSAVTEPTSADPSIHPPDAPPGYEETQQQSVQHELERRMSELGQG